MRVWERLAALIQQGLTYFSALMFKDNYTPINSSTTGTEVAMWKWAASVGYFGLSDGAGILKAGMTMKDGGSHTDLVQNGSNVLEAWSAFGIIPGSDGTLDVGISSRRWNNGAYKSNLGIHNGTRYRAQFDANFGLAILDGSGNGVFVVNNVEQGRNVIAYQTPIRMYDGTSYVGSIEADGNHYGLEKSKAQFRAVTLVNKAGGATVVNTLYNVSDAATDYSGGVITAAGFNVNINPFLVALTVGNDAVDVKYVPACDGQIVDLVATGACTIGQYVITSAATAGQVDPSAAIVPNRTVGKVLKTTVGSGAVRVYMYIR